MSIGPGEDVAALRWRIPEGRRQASLRSSLLRIGFATVIVGFLVIFLTPQESHRGLILATFAIAGIMALGQVVRAMRDASGPANVWLDDSGLHWRDAAGREQVLPRSQARSFYLGRDQQTQRDLDSLTLMLDDNFMSQPIELHPPADESRVRHWLDSRWSLPETKSLPQEGTVRLALVSEIDNHEQHWYLEGSRARLVQLAAIWQEAAGLPLPPPGARPKQVKLELGNDLVELAVSRHTWLDEGLFAATPEVLRELSEALEEKLSSPENFEEFILPVVTDTGHHWKIVVNVLGE
jgi:hypothetical protein